MEEEGDLDQEGRRRLYTCAVYTIHQLWLLVPGVDDGVGGATNPVFPGEQAAATYLISWGCICGGIKSPPHREPKKRART
jgi:hypothetical protein